MSPNYRIIQDDVRQFHIEDDSGWWGRWVLSQPFTQRKHTRVKTITYPIYYPSAQAARDAILDYEKRQLAKVNMPRVVDMGLVSNYGTWVPLRIK